MDAEKLFFFVEKRHKKFADLVLAEKIFTAFSRLELVSCERKTLLLGWWLEAGAGAM